MWSGGKTISPLITSGMFCPKLNPNASLLSSHFAAWSTTKTSWEGSTWPYLAPRWGGGAPERALEAGKRLEGASMMLLLGSVSKRQEQIQTHIKLYNWAKTKNLKPNQSLQCLRRIKLFTESFNFISFSGLRTTIQINGLLNPYRCYSLQYWCESNTAVLPLRKKGFLHRKKNREKAKIQHSPCLQMSLWAGLVKV